VTRLLTRDVCVGVEQDRANLDECSIAPWLRKKPGAIGSF
jgi:hypothetical protein